MGNEKLWNMELLFIPIVIGAFSTVTKGLIKGLEDMEIRGGEKNISNYYIIQIGKNTEKSPGYLRGNTVTQTPVKDPQLTMMWKTLKD